MRVFQKSMTAPEPAALKWSTTYERGEVCGPASGSCAEPRRQWAIRTHDPSPGAVQVSRPSTTEAVRSTYDEGSSVWTALTGSPTVRKACTATRWRAVLSDSGATTGSGSTASYVVPP